MLVPASHCRPCRLSSRMQSPLSSKQSDGRIRVIASTKDAAEKLKTTEVGHSWNQLLRWSKSQRQRNGCGEIDRVSKVTVFGGGSFGTAMGVTLARKKSSLKVHLLLRDPELAHDINEKHINTKYLNDFSLPENVVATVDRQEAIHDAEYIVHAIPVQQSRRFLTAVHQWVAPDVPIISVSKGMESATGCLMHEIIPAVLHKKQPVACISGPSFAKEVMQGCLTSLVAASRDKQLSLKVQQLFACDFIRVNASRDVVGVEVCGAIKNVLAIAAGIVEGLGLGHNAMAGLIAQGCREIRWLAKKMGARSETVAGLAGMGDIMCTCYGDLSRNRTVGVRLGRGESIHQILESMSQVAEGVTTASVVVALARRYRTQLPVLTAVAQVLDGNLTPVNAVAEIMRLPQVEER